MNSNETATTYDDIGADDVEVTKLWIVFAAVVYLVLAVPLAVADVVAPSLGLIEGTSRWAFATVNLAISALAGHAIEYGRVLINMMHAVDTE